MKKSIIGFVALLALLASYFVLRYPLFNLHGMKQWPFGLAVVAIGISCVSIILKSNAVPVFAAIGYIVGFVVGLLFHSNGIDAGGGKTNNLWLIWIVVMLCFILLGVIVAVMRVQRGKKENFSL